MADLDVREFMHGSHSDIEDSSSEDEQPCHESEVEEVIDEDDEDLEINEETATNMRSTSTSPDEDLEWKKEFLASVSQFTHPLNPFKPGFDVDTSSSRLNILKHFISDEMVDDICSETNRYAQLVKANNPRALPKWKNVSLNEMWLFLALNIAMGVLRKPSIKDYWTENDILSSPFFPKHMSRNRFEDILRCLHFVDNNGVPEGNRDRFIKLGQFLPSLLVNFKNSVNPDEYLCLDESLLGYKGRLSFRQYNPMKRSRFGIKFFVLVDCKTLVVLDIIPYQGKSTNISSAEIKKFGFGGAAVLALLEPYMGQNHKVVIDNFFNGPILAKKLLESKTYVLGTAQKRRKEMPPNMTAKLQKGSVETYSNGEILVERWHDRREVVMLNTFISHSMEPSVSSNPSNSREKPKSVLVYNKTMGGVDEMDKTVKQYSRHRKTFKWYKKVFFYMVDVAVYNSFRVYAQLHGKLRYKDYLLALVRDIIESHPVERSAKGRPLKRRVEIKENIPANLHLPTRISKLNGKPSKSDCIHCKKNMKRRQTQFKCQSCNVRLCIQQGKSCFQDYHEALYRPKRARQDETILPTPSNSECFSLPRNSEARSEEPLNTPSQRLEILSETFYPIFTSTPSCTLPEPVVVEFDIEDYIETDSNPDSFSM